MFILQTDLAISTNRVIGLDILIYSLAYVNITEGLQYISPAYLMVNVQHELLCITMRSLLMNSSKDPCLIISCSEATYLQLRLLYSTQTRTRPWGSEATYLQLRLLYSTQTRTRPWGSESRWHPHFFCHAETSWLRVFLIDDHLYYNYGETCKFGYRLSLIQFYP